MKSKSYVGLALALSVFVLVFGLWACSPGSNTGNAVPVTIGMESTAVNSLIYIAEEQGYFRANGLDVTIKDDYPSGAAASESMMAGDVDISTTAELFIVRQAFARENVLALASIDNFMHMKILVRKDLGIQDTHDLKGKRIGVPVTTAADFMLGRFLELNGISTEEVTIADVQAPHAVESIVNGEVDAVVTWQPNVIAIQEQMGDRVSVWDVQSGQPMYCVFITTRERVQNHPQMVEPLIRSLVQAEDYVIRNPDQAKGLIQRLLDYDDRYINAIWPDYQFFVRLDQSFITAMEDQARWMIRNGLTTETRVPDFLGYIYEDALKTVDPESVTIIR